VGARYPVSISIPFRCKVRYTLGHRVSTYKKGPGLHVDSRLRPLYFSMSISTSVRNVVTRKASPQIFSRALVFFFARFTSPQRNFELLQLMHGGGTAYEFFRPRTSHVRVPPLRRRWFDLFMHVVHLYRTQIRVLSLRDRYLAECLWIWSNAEESSF
jgi:hypothetical protein